MNLRKHTADQYRNIRKILRQGSSEPEADDMASELGWLHEQDRAYNKYLAFWFGLVLLLCAIASCNLAHAETIAGYDVQEWANAIYISEGGAHTHWPYGVLAHYRHTTPRMSCINTIRHQYRNWCADGHPGEFLTYLASHYAPLHANNDPHGLNANWKRNVGYYLRRHKHVRVH